MRLGAASIACLLTSCAVVDEGGHVWYKEGATEPEREAAIQAARVQAKQGQAQPAEERDIMIRVMMSQGWRLVPKESAPPLKASPTKDATKPAQTGRAVL